MKVSGRTAEAGIDALRKGEEIALAQLTFMANSGNMEEAFAFVRKFPGVLCSHPEAAAAALYGSFSADKVGTLVKDRFADCIQYLDRIESNFGFSPDNSKERIRRLVAAVAGSHGVAPWNGVPARTSELAFELGDIAGWDSRMGSAVGSSLLEAAAKSLDAEAFSAAKLAFERSGGTRFPAGSGAQCIDEAFRSLCGFGKKAFAPEDSLPAAELINRIAKEVPDSFSVMADADDDAPIYNMELFACSLVRNADRLTRTDAFAHAYDLLDPPPKKAILHSFERALRELSKDGSKRQLAQAISDVYPAMRASCEECGLCEAAEPRAKRHGHSV